MTDTVDVSKLLVNGRVGLSFRKFDKQVKQWIKTHYKHMAPYFYSSKRENIGQRQPRRRKRYATAIFELYEKRMLPGSPAPRRCLRLGAPRPPPPRMTLDDRSHLPPPVQKDVARDACRLSIPCLSSSRSLDLGHVLQLPREVSA